MKADEVQLDLRSHVEYHVASRSADGQSLAHDIWNGRKFEKLWLKNYISARSVRFCCSKALSSALVVMLKRFRVEAKVWCVSKHSSDECKVEGRCEQLKRLAEAPELGSPTRPSVGLAFA